MINLAVLLLIGLYPIQGKEVIVPEGQTYTLTCYQQDSNFCSWELEDGRRCEWEMFSQPRPCQDIQYAKSLEGSDCALEVSNIQGDMKWIGKSSQIEIPKNDENGEEEGTTEMQNDGMVNNLPEDGEGNGAGSQNGIDEPQKTCEVEIKLFQAASVTMVRPPDSSLTVNVSHATIECQTTDGYPKPITRASVKSSLQTRYLDAEESSTTGPGTYHYKFKPTLDDGGRIDVSCVTQQYIGSKLINAKNDVRESVVNFPPQPKQPMEAHPEVGKPLTVHLLFRAYPKPTMSQIEWTFTPANEKEITYNGDNLPDNFRIETSSLDDGFYDISFIIRNVTEDLKYKGQRIRVNNGVGSEDYYMDLDFDSVEDVPAGDDGGMTTVIAAVIGGVAVLIAGILAFLFRKKAPCCAEP